ncbi:dihydropteroate synthase [Salsipaludibacter albus]|uniref:dihydropteroate synthase n=1 Tax=Salsipaludibacter albus TaxID=2849650 RepID=UPI001EE49E01|nr:dihydropteroate synthase [Salsipaludibacter albus]MBY5163085.1 dihydropteroate synthase [Salsipaludibacter albus]
MTTWLSDTGATLMGIVNVNPDSFSDPRSDVDLQERLAVARRQVADGASVVDLGAQSAATHLPVVDPEAEVERLVPIVEALVADGVAVSVDTYKPAVAAAVLAAGADIVNDYSGVEHPEIVSLVADHPDARYVLTHNRGRPKQRLTEPALYDDVTGDVITFFESRLDDLDELGLPAERVVLDPGVDLSKTPSQTLAVMREVDRIASAFDLPQLWAISRKDVLGVATGRPPAQRDPATLAVLEWFADRPDTLLRVHDVAGAGDYLAMRSLLHGRADLASTTMLDPRLYRQAPPASGGA